MYCATYAANLEYPNVAIALRLPNALEYYAAISDILRIHRSGEGEFPDLDEDAAALFGGRASKPKGFERGLNQRVFG